MYGMFQRQIEINILLELYRNCLSDIIACSINGSQTAMLCTMINMLSILINISTEVNAQYIRYLMVQNCILESVLDVLEKTEVSYL